MTHRLKCWPTHFGPIMSGAKTFDLRRDDRGYNVGDTLILQEWEPETKAFTGLWLSRQVTFIMRAKPNNPIGAGYCIMAIK